MLINTGCNDADMDLDMSGTPRPGVSERRIP